MQYRDTAWAQEFFGNTSSFEEKALAEMHEYQACAARQGSLPPTRLWHLCQPRIPGNRLAMMRSVTALQLSHAACCTGACTTHSWRSGGPCSQASTSACSTMNFCSATKHRHARPNRMFEMNAAGAGPGDGLPATAPAQVGSCQDQQAHAGTDRQCECMLWLHPV